jgi:hypothetical protein
MAEVSGARLIHLTGSVPMRSTGEVMRTLGRAFGASLKRVPDGEVGRPWGAFMRPAFAGNPALEFRDPINHPYHQIGEYGLKPGVAADKMEFGAIGYDTTAARSFETFREEKKAGNLPPDCRFQISLPTPMAPVGSLIVHDDQLAVEGPYRARLLAELETIFATLPHNELAIQWDVAREFMFVEDVLECPYGDPIGGTAERLSELSDHVPSGVELGIHLCYGNFGQKHFIEPKDLGNCVAMANAISTAVTRPIQWIHMPVPRDRDDEAYFAPIRDLQLRPETHLVLGLVHHTDGVEGTHRRMSVADKFVSGYGIATECGWGPRRLETIPELIRIHTAAAEI